MSCYQVFCFKCLVGSLIMCNTCSECITSRQLFTTYVGGDYEQHQVTKNKQKQD